MPLEVTQNGINVIGANVNALSFYDDSRVLRARIYLTSDNQLNIAGTTVTTSIPVESYGGFIGGWAVVSDGLANLPIAPTFELVASGAIATRPARNLEMPTNEVTGTGFWFNNRGLYALSDSVQNWRLEYNRGLSFRILTASPDLSNAYGVLRWETNGIGGGPVVYAWGSYESTVPTFTISGRSYGIPTPYSGNQGTFTLGLKHGALSMSLSSSSFGSMAEAGAAFQYDGTNGLAIGKISFPATSPDVNLYWSAANVLKTDDSLIVAVGLNVGTFTGAGTGDIGASGYLTVGTTKNTAYLASIYSASATVTQTLRVVNAQTTGSMYAIVAAATGSGATQNIGVYGEASGATTNWAVYAAGRLGVTVAASIGGASATAGTTTALSVGPTVNADTSSEAINAIDSPAHTATGTYYTRVALIGGYPSVATTKTASGYFQGIQVFSLRPDSAADLGTYARIDGIYVQAGHYVSGQNPARVTTALSGIAVYMYLQGAASTVTTAYGLYIDSTGTATVTTPYAIYSAWTARSYLAGALNIGVDAAVTTAGHFAYSGDLRPYRNSTAYTGYIYCPMATKGTSTSFDGDSFSDTAKTTIDLSAFTNGPPAGIKAVILEIACRDSGSAAGQPFVGFSPNNTAGNYHAVVSPGGRTNDGLEYQMITVPCDANGDVYYYVDATGASTFDLWIEIVGYYI